MRKTMTNLHYPLNDQIDLLQTIIKEADNDKVIEEQTYYWAEGELERIEIELQKILALNGLYESFADEPTTAS
jgi:uncharacterized protein YbaP (TraB family)